MSENENNSPPLGLGSTGPSSIYITPQITDLRLERLAASRLIAALDTSLSESISSIKKELGKEIQVLSVKQTVFEGKLFSETEYFDNRLTETRSEVDASIASLQLYCEGRFAELGNLILFLNKETCSDIQRQFALLDRHTFWGFIIWFYKRIFK